MADRFVHRRRHRRVALDTPLGEEERRAMNRWKFACFVLLGLMGALVWRAVSAHFESAADKAIIARYVAKELEAKKFQPSTVETPKIVDLPPAVKPLVHVTGGVTFDKVPSRSETVATRGTPAVVPTTRDQAGREGAPAGFPPDSNPVTNPCLLDDLTVHVDCTTDVVIAPDGPWTRLLASGWVEGWGTRRELPPTPAGRLESQVAPLAISPKWHLDLLAGASAGDRVGWEIGASWTGKSRWGGYALAEWQPATSSSTYSPSLEAMIPTGQPATWRLHGGGRLRVK